MPLPLVRITKSNSSPLKAEEEYVVHSWNAIAEAPKIDHPKYGIITIDEAEWEMINNPEAEPSFVKVQVLADDSGHWYVVPNSELDDWDEFLYEAEDYGVSFEKKYSKYRTGGDLNMKQLYIKE